MHLCYALCESLCGGPKGRSTKHGVMIKTVVVRQACALSTSMTTTEACFVLGACFIEFFKRYTGQTPIQLKNAST